MGKKRANKDEIAPDAKTAKLLSPSSGDSTVSALVLRISRSISACQRCRAKKIKCDQNFPRCSKCEKVGVECVGLDPATGRQVPRSYVIHLEDRIAALELKLRETGVDPEAIQESGITEEKMEPEFNGGIPEQSLMNEVKFNTINTANNRPTSTNQSISFAKLMSTAVKFKDRKSNFSTSPDVDIDPMTSQKEDTQPALLPPKKTAQEFIKIYFSQSNSQLPILHREEFLKTCFLPIYGKLDDNILLASNYTAINTQMFETDAYYKGETETWFLQYKQEFNEKLTYCKENDVPIDAIKISNQIIPPIRFHKALYFLNIVFGIASSIHHLQYPSTISDSFRLAALKYVDPVYSSCDQLESLQGLLLLSIYSIMRPAVPGCWYVVGSAMRLCIDLGLQSESLNQSLRIDSFTLDKRRRLFWCTYALDRQTCFYLTRPHGIADECITTQFPSELDDAFIVPNDAKNPDYSKVPNSKSSYKSISISMFKIRKLQSEIQKMLFEKYELPRDYKTLTDWKTAMTKSLKAWRKANPRTTRKMNCDFNLGFFELNYNHSLLVLHGLSPKNFKLTKQDFFIVNETSKEVINIYSQLLASKAINYTWAAILNLFMAGTSYLYTIYNSEKVRAENSLFEVKKITQECISVMSSLVDRCEAALTCCNTLEVLTAAVVKLSYNETVHGYTKVKFPQNLKVLKNYSNSNLNNLVETLKDQLSKSDTPALDIPVLQSEWNRNEIDAFSLKLEQDLNPFNLPELAPRQEVLNDEPTPQDHGFSKPIIKNFLNNQAGNEVLGLQSPSTFEWTNSEKIYENELENFFDELEKSPVSTTSRRNSFSDTDFNSQFAYINNPNSNLLNATPYSYDSNNSTDSSPVLMHRQAMGPPPGPTGPPGHPPPGPARRPEQPAGPPPVVPVEMSRQPSKDGRRVFELIHQVPIDQIWDQFFTNNSNAYGGLN